MTGFDPGRKTIVLTHELYPYRGGIATWIEEFATAAVGLGYDLEVWGPDHPELRAKQFAFPVRGIPVPTGQGLRSQLALVRYLRAHRADWEHAQLLLPEPGPIRTLMHRAVYGLTLPERVRIVLHGTEIVRLSQFPWSRLALHALLGKAERVAVVSNYNERLLRRGLPQLGDRLRTVHAAPRTDLVAPTSWPARAGEGDDIRIITVGRIGPRKGQLAMIEAIGRLPAATRAKLVYRLAGQVNNAWYKYRLAATAKAKGVRLEILGKLPDSALRDEYLRADIFAMTSREHRGSIEGFGLVYLEAGIFRLPVLAHDTGGVPDAVVDGKTGFLVKPDDREGLADAIARLAADRGLREQMGLANEAWVGSFSWQRTVQGVLG